MHIFSVLALMLIAVAAMVGNPILWSVALLVGGLVLIIVGGDWFVDAATWIAERFRIPKFVIGATIVSLATTLPEVIVSLMAASKGQVDMAAGNAIGSVTANIGLIMGISLVAIPGVIQRKQLLPKAMLMLGAAAILTVFSFFTADHSVDLVCSVLLAAVFAFFIFENVRMARLTEDEEAAEPDTSASATVRNLMLFLLGTAGIVFGADMLVDNGTALATAIGVPEGIVAVTIIAVGTSLPELITTITAIRKKQASLSVGNIVGANTIDLALILPLCAAISGKSLPVSAQTWMLDLPVCLLIGIIALVPALISQRFHRWQGVALLVSYVAYLTCLILFFL